MIVSLSAMLAAVNHWNLVCEMLYGVRSYLCVQILYDTFILDHQCEYGNGVTLQC